MLSLSGSMYTIYYNKEVIMEVIVFVILCSFLYTFIIFMIGYYVGLVNSEEDK